MQNNFQETWIKLPAFSRKAGWRDIKVQLLLQIVQIYLNFKEQRPERRFGCSLQRGDEPTWLVWDAEIWWCVPWGLDLPIQVCNPDMGHWVMSAPYVTAEWGCTKGYRLVSNWRARQTCRGTLAWPARSPRLRSWPQTALRMLDWEKTTKRLTRLRNSWGKEKSREEEETPDN